MTSLKTSSSVARSRARIRSPRRSSDKGRRTPVEVNTVLWPGKQPPYFAACDDSEKEKEFLN